MAGRVPDLGLVVAVAVAFDHGPEAGAFVGFLAGLGFDLFVETPLGLAALAYALTAGFFLVQTDSERWSAGRWPLVYPWLHSSALSVFAVLAVLVSLLSRAVARWLRDYERYAEATAAAARTRSFAFSTLRFVSQVQANCVAASVMGLIPAPAG